MPTVTGETQLRLPKGSARLPPGVGRLASESLSSLLLLNLDSECFTEDTLLLGSGQTGDDRGEGVEEVYGLVYRR